VAEEAELVTPVVVSSAAQSKLLPFSFLETQLYDKMSKLLTSYMPAADIRYMISEIKSDLFAGFTKIDSKQLHTVIHHCKKCPNVSGSPILPSWNCTDPDLMIIVESPTIIERYGSFLFNALKQTGFSSNRCVLTYVTRCKVKELTQQNVDSCLPYLHTELPILNPKVIMPLGLSVFQFLTGDINSKLNEIKGIVRSWGTYSIIPEVSLGTLYHANEKGQGAYDAFVASLEKTYNYLYLGG